MAARKRNQTQGNESSEPEADGAEATPVESSGDEQPQDSKGPEAEKQKPKKRPEKATPAYWAGVMGQHAPRQSTLEVNKKKRGTIFSWQHTAADQLHGWSKHSLHSAVPIEITPAAYEAALKAATKPATEGKSRGQYVPHKPALSPFAKA